MRTILLTLMLVLSLTACGGKEDVPVEDPNAQAAAEGTAADGAATQAAADEPLPPAKPGLEGIPQEDLPDGPLGALHLKDGTVYDILGLKKLGKYYLYIAGKLNGRSSTVVSLTRYRDLRRWGQIGFKDPNNFIIMTKAGQELKFIDSRIYIGSDSHEKFTFFLSDGYDEKFMDVNKADVAGIVFN